MARSRHCDVCSQWHDVEQPWPSKCLKHFKRLDESNSRSAHVLGDIAPYKNVYGEVIGGRKQHRDFLKARGVIEVGNENVPQKYIEPPPVAPDIVRAMKETGNW